MIINFKEIPQANKGGGHQDRFEQFACDFLETIGFEILWRPDRGADEKKDIIVSETRKGIENDTVVKWLVSCKHFAFSGDAVYSKDEPDILDRVYAHNCNGFMGIYSTIPGSSLSKKLNGYKNKIEHTIYDSARIEREILSSKKRQRDRLLRSYFPLSYDDFHKNTILETEHKKRNQTKTNIALTEEDVLRITKTAIIILDIEKIKEEYYSSNWGERDNSLNKLYRFSDHTNEKIASEIFDFLQSIAYQTRHRMPSAIGSSIHSLILTFFPSSYETEKKERINNGKTCIHIGFNMVYDAFIYLNNFSIAGYGLLILKFIYREAKRNNMDELVSEVLKTYREIERALDRPEREDLEYAKDIVRVLKEDLDTWDLGYPIMSHHLFSLIEKNDENYLI